MEKANAVRTVFPEVLETGSFEPPVRSLRPEGTRARKAHEWSRAAVATAQKLLKMAYRVSG